MQEVRQREPFDNRRGFTTCDYFLVSFQERMYLLAHAIMRAAHFTGDAEHSGHSFTGNAKSGDRLLVYRG